MVTTPGVATVALEIVGRAPATHRASVVDGIIVMLSVIPAESAFTRMLAVGTVRPVGTVANWTGCPM